MSLYTDDKTAETSSKYLVPTILFGQHDQVPALVRGPRYLLVDPLRLPYSSHVDELETMPCRPEAWPDDALDYLPHLLDISRCDDDVLNWLYELLIEQHAAQKGDPLKRPAIYATLDCDSTIEQLAAHLGSRLLIIDPVLDDGKRVLWRFYDPSILGHLAHWILRPEQCCALLGPIKTWSFSFAGQWIACTCPTEVIRNRTGHWPDAEQWCHAERIALINQVLAQQPCDSLLESSELARQADKALAFAENVLCWIDKHEQLAFAVYALQQGMAPVENAMLIKAIQNPFKPLHIAGFAQLQQWLASSQVPLQPL